jgi:chemotaxis protein MotB
MAGKDNVKIVQGAPAWVVTFGDLMSLLLTFFVLLLSFSKVEETQKYKDMHGSMKDAFGVHNERVITLPPSALDMIEIDPEPAFETAELARELNKELVPRFPSKEVIPPEVVRTQSRVTLRFNGEAMFPAGKKQIDPRYHHFLDGIARKAKEHGSNVLVEAHTDNVPFRNAVFRSNTDLSMARSARVADYLRSVSGIEGTLVLAVGRGPYEPLYRNNTLRRRALNRRIEITFIRKVSGAESKLRGTRATPRLRIGPK